MAKKNKMTQGMSLRNRIASEYNKLIAAYANIPAAKRAIKQIDGTGGKVSVADIIAYQIGWGSLLISWYEAGVQDKQPEMPGEGFSTWDYIGLAHHFYTKYQLDSGQQQMKVLQRVVSKILEIVEHEYATGNLDKKGVWRWCTLPSGIVWPLSKWITVNTAAPYKRATALLKKYAVIPK